MSARHSAATLRAQRATTHSDRVAIAAQSAPVALIECRSSYPACTCARDLVQSAGIERVLFYAGSPPDTNFFERGGLLLDDAKGPASGDYDAVVVLNFERWARRTPAHLVAFWKAHWQEFSERNVRLSFIERHRTCELSPPHPYAVVERVLIE